MLEKFEFRVERASLSTTPGWLYRTLWRINSPAFKEFIISISNCLNLDALGGAVNGGDWKSVDAYLCVLAKFQPSFKVAFRVDLEEDENTIRKLVEERFPLVSKKGIVRIECVRRVGACVAR